MHRTCILACAIPLFAGCAAGSVQSADDLEKTSGNETESAEWRGPILLGSAGSAQVPSAVSSAPGRLDIFGAALQPDDVFELAHWWYSAGWHGPELLGGNMGSDPSATSTKSGELDVFAVDASSEGEVVSHWGFDGSWTGPARLVGGAAHGRMTAAPSAVSPSVEGLDVFAAQSSRGDPDVLSFSYAGSWATAVGLPGRSDANTSGPAAVSWGSGRLDLFAPDATSGDLVHWWFDGRWKGPALLGGHLVPAAPLSVVSWKEGRLDVFGASGTGGAFAVGVQLAHWWYDGDWHGPELLGGNISNNPSGPSAASPGEGQLDVFATDAETGQLAHWDYDGDWRGPELLGGNLRSTPSAVSQAPGSIDVFAFDLASDRLAWWSMRSNVPVPSQQSSSPKIAPDAQPTAALGAGST